MVRQRTPEGMLPNDLDTAGGQAGSDDSGPSSVSESSGPPSLADVVEWEFSDESEQVDRAHAPHVRGAGTYNELPSFEDLRAAEAVEDARGHYAALAARIGNNAGDDNEVAAEEEVRPTGLREVDAEAIATASAATERAGRLGQPTTAAHLDAAPPLAREEGHHLLESELDAADQSDRTIPWRRPPRRNPPE